MTKLAVYWVKRSVTIQEIGRFLRRTLCLIAGIIDQDSTIHRYIVTGILLVAEAFSPILHTTGGQHDQLKEADAGR
jgi:hypothetical protein